jgi:multiple sugar transport system permease protein
MKSLASRGERRRTIHGFLFLSPWLIGLLLFTAFPIIASFYYSLTDFPVLRPPRWVGFANYAYLLTEDEYFWRFAVYNTLFMFIELPLSIVMGVGVAMLLNQRLRGMAIFRTIFYLPVLVPTVASALLWLWLLNPQYGLANQALDHLGLPRIGWLQDPRWSKPSFVLMDLWGVGGGMVIYLAALQGVPQEHYEAASMDGATKWRQIWHVAIPALRPVIYFVITITIIRSMQLFEQPFIMTNGGPLNATLSIVQLLYRHAFVNLEFGYGSAIATFLLVVLVALALLNRRVHDLIVQ